MRPVSREGRYGASAPLVERATLSSVNVESAPAARAARFAGADGTQAGRGAEGAGNSADAGNVQGTVSSERPLRADARRNRARVLDAAAEAFATEGPAVPLDEIARRAGVGAGTVYRHFPTKEALLQAVLTDRLEALLAEARTALAAPEPGAAFFEYFDTMVASAEDKMDLADALARQGIDVMAATRDVGSALKQALGELLRRAQEAGAVRTDVGIADLHAVVVGAVAAARSVAAGDAGRVTALVCDALRPRASG